MATHREWLASAPPEFRHACAALRLPETLRQAAKWRRGRGLAKAHWCDPAAEPDSLCGRFAFWKKGG